VNALFRLREKLAKSKKYRESFAASLAKRIVPLQIRVLRKQRNWSQAQLAEESNLTQGVISRAEDPEYGNLTVNTLVRIGAGFDCAYVGRYVPFSELGKWYTHLEDEAALQVPSFENDSGFIERKEPQSSFSTARALSGVVNQVASASFIGTYTVTPPVNERFVARSFGVSKATENGGFQDSPIESGGLHLVSAAVAEETYEHA
jgi:transcriptional regulator with XRE-family HTH domain